MVDTAGPSVQAEESTRVGAGFTVLYAGAYFGTYVSLTTPMIVTLAVKVQDIDPAGTASGLSLLLGVGSLVAIVANPLFGALSDRTRSRFGMRRPWMIGGLVGGIAGLLITSVAPTVPLMLVGWCLTQAAWNAVLAALVAVLPDQVPSAQRGTVAGALGICAPLATFAGSFIVQAVPKSAPVMFLAPAVVGIVSVLGLTLRLRDRRLGGTAPPPYGAREFFRSFWVNPVRHRDFGWAWLSRFMILTGTATFVFYRGFYLTDHLGVHRDQVPRLIFVGLLVESAATVVGSQVSGLLSDRVARRKVFVLTSGLAYGGGLVLVALASSFPHFLAGVAVMGLALGGYMAIDLALAADVLPSRRTAGRDLGVFNIANSAPQSLAPALASAVLLLGGPDEYAVLFLVAAGFAVAGALTVWPIRSVR
jgi:MFS family permease